MAQRLTCVMASAHWVGSISEARPNATRYLNRPVPRDVAKLRSGRVAYTVCCDDRGKVLDGGKKVT